MTCRVQCHTPSGHTLPRLSVVIQKPVEVWTVDVPDTGPGGFARMFWFLLFGGPVMGLMADALFVAQDQGVGWFMGA